MSTTFTGNWINQNESRLELSEVAGIITGRFESGVGDDGAVLWVEVSGRAMDDVVTFNALYPKFGTVVSWVGQLRGASDTETIETHWIHVTNIPDNQEQAWMWFTNRIGADIFKRISKA